MEPLSIASGAAGLLSLSVQLAETLLKLRAWRNTYKEASDTVSALITSLQTLCDLLTWAKGYSDLDAESASSTAGTMRQCLHQTQTLQRCLQDKLENLDDRFNKHRLGKLSMIWNADEIDRLLTRVESCKLSFLLALQILTATRAAEGHQELHKDTARVLAEVSSLRPTHSTQKAGPVSSNTQTSCLSETNLCHNLNASNEVLSWYFDETSTITRTKLSFRLKPFGFVVEQTTSSASSHGRVTEMVPRNAGEAVVIDVWLPLRLIGSQYRLAIRRATAGWNYHVRIYREVDQLTPLMTACQTGNVVAVRQVLASGDARPYDRYAQTGQTAADMALHNCNHATYALLVAQGLTPQLSKVAWLAYFVVDAARMNFSLCSQGSHFALETFHDKASYICAGAGIDSTEVTEEEMMQAKALSHTVPYTLVSEGRERPSEKQRIAKATRAASANRTFAGVLLLVTAGICGADQFYDAAQMWFTRVDPVMKSNYLLQTTVFDGPKGAMHLGAEMLGYGIAHSKDTTFWVQLLHNAIATGVDISMGDCLGSRSTTPLTTFVIALLEAHRLGNSDEDFILEQLDDGLRVWLAIICEHDVDLLRYGEVETCNCEKSHPREGVVFATLTKEQRCALQLRDLRGLQFGRATDDWHLAYDSGPSRHDKVASLEVVVRSPNDEQPTPDHNDSAQSPTARLHIPGAFE